MNKQTIYTYLGTNGTLCTPIHLEGIYCIKKIQLTASEGNTLTKDGVNFKYSVMVPEDEAEQWYEVKK